LENVVAMSDASFVVLYKGFFMPQAPFIDNELSA
jgi:hypothetical protein